MNISIYQYINISHITYHISHINILTDARPAFLANQLQICLLEYVYWNMFTEDIGAFSAYR